MGILTLEDVLEALLQEPIYDEMDAAGRRVRPLDSNDEADGTTPAPDNEANRYHPLTQKRTDARIAATASPLLENSSIFC